MTRAPRLVKLFCVFVLVLCVSALAIAEDPKPVVKTLQATPMMHAVQPQFPPVAGLWQLQNEAAQKELELVPDQVEKLKALGKKYYEDARADAGIWGDYRSLTPEQQKAKYAEYQEKAKKRMADLRAEVDKILLPHQVSALKEINLRQTGGYMLMNPRTVETLGITEQQKAQIQKARDEMQEKSKQLQKEFMDKLMQVLTPEQKEKLKDQTMKAYGF
jgi:Spy/CpxP family protein refolding chaperone